MKITNGFNKYFVSIGPTLARDIPQDYKSSTTYMENRVFESMVITPVIVEEVQSIIKNLKDSSAGWDSICCMGGENNTFKFYCSINIYYEHVLAQWGVSFGVINCPCDASF